MDGRELGKARLGQRYFADEWPAYNASAIGLDLPEVKWSYSGDELAHSLVSAVEQEGRPSLVQRLETAGLGRPGSDRAARLLKLGRKTYSGLLAADWDLCPLEAACLPGRRSHTAWGAVSVHFTRLCVLTRQAGIEEDR